MEETDFVRPRTTVEISLNRLPAIWYRSGNDDKNNIRRHLTSYNFLPTLFNGFLTAF